MFGITGIFAYQAYDLDVDKEELRNIRDHMYSGGPEIK